MSNVKIPGRWYLTEDGSRAVPDGDPNAARLLCTAGGEVSRETAARYGLLDEPEEPEVEPEEKPDDNAEGKPEEKTEPKARTAAANKARAGSANKGRQGS